MPTANGAYLAYYQAIENAITNSQPNPVPAEDALAVMKVLEAASDSVSSGKELAYSS